MARHSLRVRLCRHNVYGRSLPASVIAVIKEASQCLHAAVDHVLHRVLQLTAIRYPSPLDCLQLEQEEGESNEAVSG